MNIKPNITDFSHELLCHILRYLPLKEILSVAMLCKKMLSAVNMHLQLCKSIDFCQDSNFGYMPPTITDDHLLTLLKKCPHLETVYGLHPLKIERRRLRKRAALTIPGIIEALSLCFHLKAIETSDLRLFEAIMQHLPQLEIIGHFQNRNGFFPPHASQRLKLQPYPRISSLHLIGVEVPELTAMPHLQHLHLQCVRFTKLQPFRAFLAQNLKSFVMKHCIGPSVPQRYLSLIIALSSSPNLSHLELVRVPLLNGLFQRAVEDSYRHSGFVNLRTLVISGCKGILEADLGHLMIVASKKLETLYIQPSLTKDSLFVSLSFAQCSFPVLENLHLGYIDNLNCTGEWSNDALITFGLAEVPDTPSSLTDSGMKVISRLFPNIRTLSVSNCPHLMIMYHWMVEEDLSSWSRLSDLTLQKCHCLQLSSFVLFISFLPNIQVVILNDMFREPPKGCSHVGLSAGTGLGMSSAVVSNQDEHIAVQGQHQEFEPPGDEENEEIDREFIDGDIEDNLEPQFMVLQRDFFDAENDEVGNPPLENEQDLVVEDQRLNVIDNAVNNSVPVENNLISGKSILGDILSSSSDDDILETYTSENQSVSDSKCLRNSCKKISLSKTEYHENVLSNDDCAGQCSVDFKEKNRIKNETSDDDDDDDFSKISNNKLPTISDNGLHECDYDPYKPSTSKAGSHLDYTGCGDENVSNKGTKRLNKCSDGQNLNKKQKSLRVTKDERVDKEVVYDSIISSQNNLFEKDKNVRKDLKKRDFSEFIDENSDKIFEYTNEIPTNMKCYVALEKIDIETVEVVSDIKDGDRTAKDSDVSKNDLHHNCLKDNTHKISLCNIQSDVKKNPLDDHKPEINKAHIDENKCDIHANNLNDSDLKNISFNENNVSLVHPPANKSLKIFNNNLNKTNENLVENKNSFQEITSKNFKFDSLEVSKIIKPCSVLITKVENDYAKYFEDTNENSKEIFPNHNFKQAACDSFSTSDKNENSDRKQISSESLKVCNSFHPTSRNKTDTCDNYLPINKSFVTSKNLHYDYSLDVSKIIKPCSVVITKVENGRTDFAKCCANTNKNSKVIVHDRNCEQVSSDSFSTVNRDKNSNRKQISSENLEINNSLQPSISRNEADTCNNPNTHSKVLKKKHTSKYLKKEKSSIVTRSKKVNFTGVNASSKDEIKYYSTPNTQNMKNDVGNNYPTYLSECNSENLKEFSEPDQNLSSDNKDSKFYISVSNNGPLEIINSETEESFKTPHCHVLVTDIINKSYHSCQKTFKSQKYKKSFHKQSYSNFESNCNSPSTSKAVNHLSNISENVTYLKNKKKQNCMKCFNCKNLSECCCNSLLPVNKEKLYIRNSDARILLKECSSKKKCECNNIHQHISCTLDTNVADSCENELGNLYNEQTFKNEQDLMPISENSSNEYRISNYNLENNESSSSSETSCTHLPQENNNSISCCRQKVKKKKRKVTTFCRLLNNEDSSSSEEINSDSCIQQKTKRTIKRLKRSFNDSKVDISNVSHDNLNSNDKSSSSVPVISLVSQATQATSIDIRRTVRRIRRTAVHKMLPPMHPLKHRFSSKISAKSLTQKPKNMNPQPESHDKATSTSDPLLEDDIVQVLQLSSNTLLSFVMISCGISDLIVDQCPKLIHIEVQACRIFKRFKFNNCPVMRRLNVSQCPKLNISALAESVMALSLDSYFLVSYEPCMQGYHPGEGEKEILSKAPVNQSVLILHDLCDASYDGIQAEFREKLLGWLHFLSQLHLCLNYTREKVNKKYKSEDVQILEYPWFHDLRKIHGDYSYSSSSDFCGTEGQYQVLTNNPIFCDIFETHQLDSGLPDVKDCAAYKDSSLISYEVIKKYHEMKKKFIAFYISVTESNQIFDSRIKSENF